MEVRNCRSCGRLFNYMGGAPLCPACQKKLEEKFQEVKAFLEENPNSSVETVAEELDVSVKQTGSGFARSVCHFPWQEQTALSVRPAGSRSAREDFARSARTIWRTRLQSRFISRSRRSRRRQSGIKTACVFSNNTKRINRAWVSGSVFCFENK